MLDPSHMQSTLWTRHYSDCTAFGFGKALFDIPFSQATELEEEEVDIIFPQGTFKTVTTRVFSEP